MKLLAFAASNSRNSINKQLATYASTFADNAEVEILDINDYEMPIFSIEREEELGHPKEALAFFDKIGDADGLIISFAEHNGSYTAAYKNLFDWTSRIDQKLFQNKPMVLLATSPGPGGAKNVLAAAKNSAPYFAGNVQGDLSIPRFHDVFDTEKGQLIDKDLDNTLRNLIIDFCSSINGDA